MGQELTIAEVADELGLSAHTLRYYERAGLLEGIPRNQGGHRRYVPQNVEMLRFLIKLRRTGMPIHQIREYAELVRQGDSTIPDRLALLESHRKAIIARIAELQENLQAVDFKIERYDSLCQPQAPISVN